MPSCFIPFDFADPQPESRTKQQQAASDRRSDRITPGKVRHLLLPKLKAKQASSASPVQLVGLVFTRPELEFFKSHLRPNFKYWNHRSADHVDFFCMGFTLNAPRDFSHVSFLRAVDHFERETQWRYTGENDLILLNAVLDPETKRVTLDYSSAVVLPLDEAVRKKAIKSAPEFFERIIAYASRYRGDDPTWGFSDALVKPLAGSALKRFLLSLLPKFIRTETEHALFFAIRDIGK
jgi:hypothetical protein